MLGPSSKDGTQESGDSGVSDGRVSRPMVGTTETVVPVVETVSTVDDNERHGGLNVAAAPAAARPPPRTQATREIIPSRTRTKEVATTEPPRQRRKTKSTTPCCDCTRHSTCTSLGAKGRPGCACLLAKRKCSGCACFRRCRNKRSLLPKAAADRQTGSTLRAYFPSQAADANPAGDLLTQPPDPQGHGDPERAADSTPAAATPTAATPPAPSQGSGDDDTDTDDEDEPTNEPAATRRPNAADIGDPFVPALPGDHTGGPQDAEERPIERKDPGADRPGFEPVPADKLLEAVYGDWPHQNDGRHLDGGVEGDATWQRRWRRIADLSTTHYAVPKGNVGRRFVNTLAKEFDGVRARTWNSERPLVFVAVVLQTTPGVKRSRDIRRRLGHRMDLWYQGKFTALVDDTETEVQSRHGSHPVQDDETKARAFNSKVLSGRIRPAVRNLTSRDQGGVLQPDDACTKTGQPVLEVLRGKHPPMRDPAPDLEDPDRGSFEPYPSLPEPVPVEITGDVVEKVASKLSGAAGPGGTDAIDLRNWLLRHGAESEFLRNSLASIAEWLANESPPWAAYRALMACRLVALDKSPGVRPVGIGEVYRRLLAKCVLEAVGHQATAAAGNLNLCAGLPAGIEGAIHAVRQEMDGPPIPPACAPRAKSL